MGTLCILTTTKARSALYGCFPLLLAPPYPCPICRSQCQSPTSTTTPTSRRGENITNGLSRCVVRIPPKPCVMQICKRASHKIPLPVHHIGFCFQVDQKMKTLQLSVQKMDVRTGNTKPLRSPGKPLGSPDRRPSLGVVNANLPSPGKQW